MISVSDLEFRYRASADADQSAFRLYVDSFEVAGNSSTALIGPSGSGKTTLLGLIAGTLRPTGGRIVVGDHVLSDFKDHEIGRFRIRNVGQVFQSFELLNYLTVLENVMLPWYVVGEGRKSGAVTRARELLDSVGLGQKSGSLPGQLSQGEQQRVAVCRAMFNRPQVLLADEPTGNLDSVNKQQVVDLLCQQAQSHGSTLLMVTHDESLLGRFDSVIEMSAVARPTEAASQA